MGPPQEPPVSLQPKILHEFTSETLDERHFNAREFTMDKITVTDGRGGGLQGVNNYMLAVTSVRCRHEHLIAEMRYTLRYEYLLNGVVLAAKEFASDTQGRMGRLLVEETATIGALERKEYKK